MWDLNLTVPCRSSSDLWALWDCGDFTPWEVPGPQQLWALGSQQCVMISAVMRQDLYRLVHVGWWWEGLEVLTPVSRVLGLLSRAPPRHIRWPGLLWVILLDGGSLVHLLFGTRDSFTTY